MMTTTTTRGAMATTTTTTTNARTKRTRRFATIRATIRPTTVRGATGRRGGARAVTTTTTRATRDDALRTSRDEDGRARGAVRRDARRERRDDDASTREVEDEDEDAVTTALRGVFAQACGFVRWGLPTTGGLACWAAAAANAGTEGLLSALSGALLVGTTLGVCALIFAAASACVSGATLMWMFAKRTMVNAVVGRRARDAGRARGRARYSAETRETARSFPSSRRGGARRRSRRTRRTRAVGRGQEFQLWRLATRSARGGSAEAGQVGRERRRRRVERRVGDAQDSGGFPARDVVDGRFELRRARWASTTVHGTESVEVSRGVQTARRGIRRSRAQRRRGERDDDGDDEPRSARGDFAKVRAQRASVTANAAETEASTHPHRGLDRHGRRVVGDAHRKQRARYFKGVASQPLEQDAVRRRPAREHANGQLVWIRKQRRRRAAVRRAVLPRRTAAAARASARRRRTPRVAPGNDSSAISRRRSITSHRRARRTNPPSSTR